MKNNTKFSHEKTKQQRILRIMKVSFLGIFLSIGFAFAASTYSQETTFTLKSNNSTIKEVFREIEESSEFIFFYLDNSLDLNKKVSIDANNQKVDIILDQIFEGTSNRYHISDRQIIISKEKVTDQPAPQQSTRTITGVVSDTYGPVVGANVVIKGTTIGAVTDIDGNFSLSNVPENATLQVSYIGYKPQEMKVGNQSSINITLVEDSEALDEVVVIGYGVQKKANLTGSVASLNSEALESRSVASVSAALAGQMPGITSIQNSGAPGLQTGKITIRGKNSINAAEPMVIIDGIPSNMNTLNMLDPLSIDNMSVLKDAASSAIYGVQAANGVILVTTKQGKNNQASQVRYSGSVAWASPTTLFDYLGSADYATLYNVAVRNDNPNAPLPYTEEDIQKYRDGSSPQTHPNTDWYKETFKSSAVETFHTLSISGGSASTTYNASLGYTHQDGLVDQNNYERFNVRSNLNSKINKWLTAGLNVFGHRGTRNDGWDDYGALRQFANRISPTIPVYNEDGTYSWSGLQNPVAHRGNSGYKRYVEQEVNAQAHLTVNILPELSVKGLFAVQNRRNDDTGFKRQLIYGNYAEAREREGYNKHYNRNWYTFNLLANYMKTFGKHTVNLLAGMETREYLYRFTEATRTGGGNNELEESLNSLDAANQTNKGGGNEIARMSYFGRVQYDFENKYLFEANFRADASSLFPKDNRWGYFPSFSGGWRITEESFVKDADISWLSNLKLRVGWGKTGNEELDSETIYPAVATYAYGAYIFNQNQYSTTYESRYVNNNLKWATVTNLEAAIEAGFFNNKLSFELSYYNKKTKDMLLTLPVPGLLGMDAPYQNAGSMKNTGFDLSISHNNQINKDFGYAINFNLAYVKNEITDMSGTEGEEPKNEWRWYKEGYPLGSFYGYVADGFFNTEEELAAGPKRTSNGIEQLGDIRYKDLNGDGKITAADDRQVIGKDFPSWTAGLNFTVYYKNFDLYALFQGAFDVEGYYVNEAAYAFFNSGKVMKRHLDYWRPDNLNASYPRLTKDDQINYQKSSFWLQNADYVRLKNISLGYNIPKPLLMKLGIQRLKVYVAGENLLTFTGLDGLDPEAPSTNRGAFYSNVKKFSFGLDITF